MKHDRTLRTLLVTLALVGLIAVIEAGVIVVANVTAWGPANFETGTQLYLTALLALGTVLVFALLTALLVGSGVDDTLGGRPRSPLYLPALGIMALIVLILTPTAIVAVDLLLHDLTPRWRLTSEPELALWTRVLFVLLCVMGGWFTIVVLAGRGWSRRAIGFTVTALVAIALSAALYPLLT